MLDIIRDRLGGWKGKFRSSGGKFVLIKSVIEAMPTYIVDLIQPPKAIIKAIYKIMSDFFLA